MENSNRSSALQYKVYTVKRPGLTRDPNMPAVPEALKWVANSSTIIYGERDAVLVDCFLTIDQTQELVEFVRSFNRNLTYIYITHPHGDHFFGLKILLDNFPEAKAITAGYAAAAMTEHIAPKIVDGFWRKLFPGQILETLIVPEGLPENHFELEGNRLEIINDGFTDTHNSTSLWVPSLKLIVGGDAVYNGIHAFLAESTGETRKEWVAALDQLAALKPDFVVAGHKQPQLPDQPDIIARTKQYLEDFEELNKATSTVAQFFSKMMEKYPDYVNPGSLWGAVSAAKKSAGI